ncbi:MAG: hypothetical protein DSY42_07370 [Aquifex sp.]|nr:MAG: hypothetical protein DSY42_07370 [Aquifex sp.]
MAGRLEELMKKLAAMNESKEEQEKIASQKEEVEKKAEEEKKEEGIIKLSEEDIEFLQALGQAYIEGLIAGMYGTEVEKQAEDSGVEVVDMDGDGEPDHIVADAEQVVNEIVSMAEEGEISPEEADQLLDMVAAQLSDEEAEKTAEELEKIARFEAIRNKAAGILGAIKGYAGKIPGADKVKSGLGYLTGAKAFSEVRGRYETLKGIAGEVAGGKSKRALAGKAVKDVWRKNKKAILLPLGFYGGLGAGAIGISKMRGND